MKTYFQVVLSCWHRGTSSHDDDGRGAVGGRNGSLGVGGQGRGEGRLVVAGLAHGAAVGLVAEKVETAEAAVMVVEDLVCGGEGC